MADFDVELVNGDGDAIPSSIWTDPAIIEDPTRISPRGHVQHRYSRVVIASGFTGELFFQTIVGGVRAPADAALGGRLFSWAFGIWPAGAPIPMIVSPYSGKTSRAAVTFYGTHPGHFVIVAGRPDGGHIGYPIDIEAS